MYQFLESIQAKNGQLLNLHWHQQRVDRTFRSHYPNNPSLKIDEITKAISIPESGCYKLRLVYNATDFEFSVRPYLVRKIERVGLVEIENYTYSFKYSARGFFDSLHNLYPNYDEFILIKNKEITDGTYANIVLANEHERHTPSGSLLAGTCQARLMAEKQISSKTLFLEDLQKYQSLYFINAMRSLQSELAIPIQQIDWERILSAPTIK